jgi:hypothetical protein
MHLPARVQGWNADHAAWPQAEMSATLDISSCGCALELLRPLSKGQVLQLTLPLPKNFRDHDLDAASYRVYGMVAGWLAGASRSQLPPQPPHPPLQQHPLPPAARHVQSASSACCSAPVKRMHTPPVPASTP